MKDVCIDVDFKLGHVDSDVVEIAFEASEEPYVACVSFDSLEEIEEYVFDFYNAKLEASDIPVECYLDGTVKFNAYFL